MISYLNGILPFTFVVMMCVKVFRRRIKLVASFFEISLEAEALICECSFMSS